MPAGLTFSGGQLVGDLLSPGSGTLSVIFEVTYLLRAACADESKLIETRQFQVEPQTSTWEVLPALSPSDRTLLPAEDADIEEALSLAEMKLTGEGMPRDVPAAVKWYRSAAERGLMEAQYTLGTLYENGVEGVQQQDRAEAARWYRSAADQGHTESQMWLANAYRHGEGGLPQDYSKAALWYRFAGAEELAKTAENAAAHAEAIAKAEDGDIKAALSLAEMYLGGEEEVPRDYPAAAKWLRIAAEGGHSGAQYSLGTLYAKGVEGVPQDVSSAVKWYRTAAERGHIEAQYVLGELYLFGDEGVPRDVPVAVKWYRTAAERGHMEAQYSLGSVYEFGDEGVPQDLAEAARWYRSAAEQGEPTSQMWLAIAYHHGVGGLPQDYTQAARWYRLAEAEELAKTAENAAAHAETIAKAEDGDVKAALLLAEMYLSGEDVPRDVPAAVKWYRTAAERGHIEAQYALGELYYLGDEGVPQDVSSAVKWYRTAAERGHIEAQYVLGELYLFGDEGVPRDVPVAVKWYRTAAERGHMEAQYSLGSVYEFGDEGVPQDLAEAARWYRSAAEQGEPTSQMWLAIAYHHGERGLPQDYTQAARWYRLAGAEELAKNVDALIESRSERSKTEATARARLRTVGDGSIMSAGVYCKEHVEDLAKYTHKWTDGILGLKFSQFEWKDYEKSIVRYWGDEILFQNGFGAWVKHVYWCDYDTVNEEPLRVGAEPGRLSDLPE